MGGEGSGIKGHVTAQEQADKIFAAHLTERGMHLSIRQPDGSVQCHESIAHVLQEIPKTIDSSSWKARVEPHVWDETKWTAVGEELKKSPLPPALERNEHIHNLVVDIKDGSVNGHSFVMVGRHGVDPYLDSLGVPARAIDSFDQYMKSVYTRAGVK